MEPHVFLPSIAIFLHHPDFVNLCSVSHAFNDPTYTEPCWDQLVRRDFVKIARYLRAEDHKSTYIRAYRLYHAWRSGRSLVPVPISRKFCALNDQGYGIFYLRDSYRTNFTFAHGELKENDLYKDWSEVTSEWIQSISDCAISDTLGDENGNILVACCGLGGAFVHDYNGVNSPQKVTIPPSTHQSYQSTPNKVVFGQNQLGIAGVGLDQCLAIYDVNRLDQPIFSDVQSEPNVESSLCLYVNDNNVTVAYSSGTLIDYDLRVKSRLKQHCSTTLRAFTVAKHDNNYRYYATPEACFMTDIRISRDFDHRSAVHQWHMAGISCLAAPHDTTVVLGFDSQFSDPLMSLTLDHVPRHLFFASEKYYRVSWLKCTNSVLLAGCTDLIRLFDFSIDPKPKYSSRGS